MSAFDAIVIGTGQAGPALARRLAGAGWRVAIAERARFGGTCINTGCTPTKTMLASAYAAHLARRGTEFGVLTGGPVKIDMRRVKARKNEIVGVGRAAVERSLRETQNVTVLQGHARFVSPREVEVGETRLSSERIFVNVGGRPSIPPIPGLGQTPYLTSSTILDLDSVPRRLVVIGGGYIGLEFGQMFRRFGAEVTIVETASRLIPREDPEIADAMRSILEAEGIEILLDASDPTLRADGTAIALSLRLAGADRIIHGSHLLLGAGRRPNTDDLGTEQAGIALDAHGYVQVDEQLRTNVPGIWALGECNGHGAFTHTAYNDSEIVGANLLGGGPRSLHDRIAAYALFTDPPLGRAGLSEAEARKSGRRVLVGRIAMEDVSRAYEKGETLGMMKIVVDDDSKEILGAAFLGTSGDEAIHCVLDLMYAKAPYMLLRRAVHIHPTVSEFIPSLLDGIEG
ncbi:MAG: FAD-containing oxidoreductase [Acetobacteraceae bacterium]|nr:FAD-containing oxidoreductase [Acetobacteraceae bacterium]